MKTITAAEIPTETKWAEWYTIGTSQGLRLVRWGFYKGYDFVTDYRQMDGPTGIVTTEFESLPICPSCKRFHSTAQCA